MAKHYYLCRGYNTENFIKSRLIKIFDNKKTIEEIDLFTLQFDNLEALKEYLFNQNLILSKDEEIVIGCNKTINKETKEKKLVPIFIKELLFKQDLKSLGFEITTYKDLAQNIWDYVKERQNDKDFMEYIMSCYTEKYKDSEAPIFKNGDINIIKTSINRTNLSEQYVREYELSFINFFRNEIFKCEQVLKDVTFDGKSYEKVTVFKPIEDKINTKGLHDLVARIILYKKYYKNNYCYVEEKIEEDEQEEFFEYGDFLRPLEQYAKENGLDIYDEETLAQDDYANSFIVQKNLVKKTDGME